MLHPNPDSVNNFSENGDGGSAAAWKWNRAGIHLNANPDPTLPLPTVLPRPDYNGYAYAKDIVRQANGISGTNQPMALPAGNSTPNPAKNIGYVLNGVYFHRDANMWQYDPANHYAYPAGVVSPAQFDTYGVEKGTEINIFLMGQNTWEQNPNVNKWIFYSGGAASYGYRANNNWMKIGNIWRNHLINRVNDPQGDDNSSPWLIAHTLNHEMGHLLGLYHPADITQCSDCPPAVYNIGAGNNLMDYNYGLALTPCQLGIMHGSMRNNFLAYELCGNSSCTPTHAFFTVPGCVPMWGGNTRPVAMLDGRGSWVPGTGAYYETTLFEADANGYVVPGTRLPAIRGAGEPGLIDLAQLYQLQPDKRYGVILTVGSDCTGHSTRQYFTTSSSGCSVVYNPQRTPEAARNNKEVVGAANVNLFPNPAATGEFTVTTTGRGPVWVVVRDAQGQPVPAQVRANEATAAAAGTSGPRTATCQMAAPRTGLYLVEVTCDGHRTVRKLTVQ